MNLYFNCIKSELNLATNIFSLYIAMQIVKNSNFVKLTQNSTNLSRMIIKQYEFKYNH